MTYKNFEQKKGNQETPVKLIVFLLQYCEVMKNLVVKNGGLTMVRLNPVY